jgi:hypothetical protein
MFVCNCTIDIHKQRIASNSPLDNTTGTQLEGQWRFALVAGIELGSVGLQGAAVVHGNSVAAGGLASALDGVGYFDAEVGGSCERAEGCDEDGGETHCVFWGGLGRGMGEMRSWMWTDRRGLDRGLALVCALSLCLGGCKVYVVGIIATYVLLITYILSIILDALGLEKRGGS